MAWISCSLANGSVVIVEVSQTLVTSDSGSGFGPHFTVQTAAALKKADSFVVDKRGLTALRWIDIPGKTVSRVDVFVSIAIELCPAASFNTLQARNSPPILLPFTGF
jgi:hypothetical protein